MKVLFDQGVPAPLRYALRAHEVVTAFERGWSELKNGDLLARAEAAGFEVFVTTDRNLKYQQNLSSRGIAIIVLLTTSWPKLREDQTRIAASVDSVSRGAYVEISAV
jgi:hypothetical protein